MACAMAPAMLFARVPALRGGDCRMALGAARNQYEAGRKPGRGLVVVRRSLAPPLVSHERMMSRASATTLRPM